MSTFFSNLIRFPSMNSYEFFAKGYSEYENILLNFRNNPNAAPYVDNDFMYQKNIESSIKFNSSIVWKRIDDIYPVPLFQKELIHPNYIIQGQIGDDYLISALSQFSKDSSEIPSLFECSIPNSILHEVENSINLKSGAVLIYLHAFGRRTPILIDTLIPMIGNEPLYSHPIKGKSPWFCLVEKAYAKLKGSYTKISGGFFTDAMFSLVGNLYPKEIDLAKERKDLIIRKINKYIKSGFPIEASIHLNDSNKSKLYHQKYNLIEKHSYLLLNMIEIDRCHFFYLDNPWGNFEWNGDYSINSPLLTPELRKKLGNPIGNGLFYMIDKDFFEFFTKIEVAKTFDTSNICQFFQLKLPKSKETGVNLLDLHLEQIPNFAIQIVDSIDTGKSVKVHILIEKQRKNKQSIITLAHVNGKKLSAETLAHCNYSRKIFFRNVFAISSSFEKQDDVITFAICNYGSEQVEEEYCIKVFCECNFKLYNIDQPNVIFQVDNDYCSFKQYLKSLRKSVTNLLNDLYFFFYFKCLKKFDFYRWL